MFMGIEPNRDGVKIKITIRDKECNLSEKTTDVLFWACFLLADNRIARVAVSEEDIKQNPCISISDFQNMMGNPARPLYTKRSGKNIAAFGGYIS